MNPPLLTAPAPGDALASARAERFRLVPARRVTTLEDAVAFVDDVGLCVFQGDKGGLPTFYGAVAGHAGPAPRWGERDPDYGRAWDLKDRIFGRQRVYYGKALGDYRLMIARQLLPYVLAACAPGATTEDDDYLTLYQDGLLGADAKQIFEALLAGGPASTARLRKAAHFDGKGPIARRFDRALTELQRAFLVAPVGIDRDNRWKYTFRYAPLHTAFSRECAAAAELSSRAATEHVLRHYLDLVGPCQVDEPRRLFGWPRERHERVVAALLASGVIQDAVRDGVRLIQLVPDALSAG